MQGNNRKAVLHVAATLPFVLQQVLSSPALPLPHFRQDQECQHQKTAIKRHCLRTPPPPPPPPPTRPLLGVKVKAVRQPNHLQKKECPLLSLHHQHHLHILILGNQCRR